MGKKGEEGVRFGKFAKKEKEKEKKNRFSEKEMIFFFL